MNRITIQESKNSYSFNELNIGRFFALNDENVFYIKVNDYTALSCDIIRDIWELIHIEPAAPVMRYDADIMLKPAKEG